MVLYIKSNYVRMIIPTEKLIYDKCNYFDMIRQEGDAYPDPS